MSTVLSYSLPNVVLRRFTFVTITFLALLIKNIFLTGFSIDSTETSIEFSQTMNVVIENFSIYVGFILVILSLSFLFKGKLHIWYLTIINALVSILFIIDLWYFRGFRTLPSPLIVRQIDNLENLSDSIASMIRVVDFLFLADLILLAILLGLSRGIIHEIKPRPVIFAITLIISLIFLVYRPVKNYYDGKEIGKDIIDAYDPGITIRNLSPLGYHFYSAYMALRNGGTESLTDDDIYEINKWFKENKESVKDNEYKALFAGKNLILIQVESLEKFVINQRIEGQEITPNLNRLLKNSLYFNIHEQINQGNSSDAELMANTAIYPMRDYCTFFTYPATTYNSLPKLLQKRQYSTLASHGDRGSYWNWKLGLSYIGFEKCLDISSFNNNDFVIMGLSDSSFLSQIVPKLKKQTRPFYSFLVTLSSHADFDLPQHLRMLNLKGSTTGTFLGNYFQCLQYTDRQIGYFIKSLEDNKLLDNTVVAMYGDHEGVHKYYQKYINGIKPAEDWWLKNHKQLPFIIYHKNLEGKTFNTIGGQVDIMPTLCYLLGIDEEEYLHSAIGRNLLKTQRNFVVLADGTYIGDTISNTHLKHALQGLKIADKIIRSNYFSVTDKKIARNEDLRKDKDLD